MVRARLGGVVRVLLILAGLSPWLPLLAARVPWLEPLARIPEMWFQLQCHREPARSLFISSEQLPVCARCFGIYSGMALGALVMRPRLGRAALTLCVGLAVLVMLLDVLTEALSMRPESALLRVLTGMFLSWPIAVELVVFARQFARAPERV